MSIIKMKIFVLKTLFIVFCFLIAFHLSVGFYIKKINSKFDFYTSKENLSSILLKLREETKSAIKKDQILSEEDAKLIKEIISKLSNEIGKK